MSDSALILIVIAGISLLLFLIIRSKLHAFVALLLVSLLVGAAAGMPLDKVIESIQNGMGGTLGFVAVVVGLGAMFGQMLEVSGEPNGWLRRSSISLERIKHNGRSV